MQSLVVALIAPVGELAISLHDQVAASVADLHTLVAQALTSLVVALAGINELYLALTLTALVLCHHPDVSGNAGIIEQVVGQLHDGLQPVVLVEDFKLQFIEKTGMNIKARFAL